MIASNLAVSIIILVYASWRDYVCREVSNKVWIVYAPIALAITLTELVFYETAQLPFFGLSAGVTVFIAFLLFYVGGFGGADSKALMCIALALPFAPLALFTPILSSSISPISQLIFPITIFGNGVLFAAASGFYMILRNLTWHKKNRVALFPGSLAHESIGKKLLVLVTGYKMDIGKLKEKWHIFPMEDINQNAEMSNRKLVIVPKDEGRDQILERLSLAIENKRIDSSVWATPGLPMLIFVTLGLIVAVVFGDIVWLLVRFFLGAL